MKKRLFLYTTLIMFAGLICFFAVTVYITHNNNLRMAKDAVMETTLIFAGFYDDDDMDAATFVNIGEDTRITVILPDGSVLADNRPLDAGAMENRLYRPEVQAALNDSPAAYVRYSETLGVDLVYYALKVDDGDDAVVIRAAIPVAEIDAYLLQSLPLLAFLFIIIVLLCFLFSRSMIGRVTKPFESVEQKLRLLSNGEYISEPHAGSYDEIDAITREIDEVALVLQNSFVSLQEEKSRSEEFFANASHELKTPLTAIKGFNELTAINNKDEKISKYIGSITRETDRMLRLVGNMMKLSQLETERETNPVPVSLASIIGEVCDTLSSASDGKSIVIETSGDCTVEAEREHVYELVKNLVENAVRYNNKDGKVSVAAGSDNNSAWLTVSDNGIGIAPDEQSRVFDRFYRVEKSRSQRSGGTGLGLPIVKNICALYGWKLSLRSAFGDGTEITVLFGGV